MKHVIEGTKESAGHDNSKPWYLVGIVSFGTCGKANPGIFTRWEIVIQHPTKPFNMFYTPGWRVSFHGSRRLLVTKTFEILEKNLQACSDIWFIKVYISKVE